MVESKMKLKIETDMAPIRHDGWKSRKVILGIAVFFSVLAVGTAALFFGHADFEQLSSLIKWLVPSVYVPLAAAMTAEKFAEQRRLGDALGAREQGQCNGCGSQSQD